MLTGTKQALPALKSGSGSLRQIEPNTLFSVIVRTRGNRQALLREALASLFVQTETRYEVLLCVHSNAGAESEVKRIVGEFPNDFARRVRILSVEGGGRCRPLNEAIEVAKGRFVCMLDDDDLMLDNHLSVIASEAETGPEQRAFHTFGGLRSVQVFGPESYTTAGIQLSYTLPFTVPLQLVENSIPICNLFVSTHLIDAFELRFDETYDVLEDWKFLMEVNRYTTIATVPVVTTVINVRTDQSNTVNDPVQADNWMHTRVRLREELLSKSRVLSPEELADVYRFAVILDGQSRDPSFEKAMALAPLVKRFERFIPKGVRSAMRRKLADK